MSAKRKDDKWLAQDRQLREDHPNHTEVVLECGICWEESLFDCPSCGATTNDAPGIEVELYCYSKYNVRVRHIAVVCKDCEVDTV